MRLKGFMAAFAAVAAGAAPAAAHAAREFLAYADAGASAETRAARDAFVSDPPPFVKALQETCGAGRPVSCADLKADIDGRDHAGRDRQALNHVAIFGTPAEGDVAKRTRGYVYGIDTAKKELWRLGFGRFAGDVGCVDMDFNPWLYSGLFSDNPFSTLMIRISGTTPAGVKLAAEAFRKGMINGVVLGPGARRAEKTILDRDPSTEPPPEMPARFTAGGRKFVLAGWSQCPENELRAPLDSGLEKKPEKMWRVKYFEQGFLDTAEGTAWIKGPHEMAWGNAVTLMAFADPAVPRAFAGKLRGAVQGAAPAPGPEGAFRFKWAAKNFCDDKKAEDVTCWAQGRYFVMCSLPREGCDGVAAALAKKGGSK